MIKFTGAIGTNDNDIVYTSGDVSEFDEHVFRSQAGVVTVEAKVNGTWGTDLAFTDLQSTTPDTKVLVTTDQVSLYRLEGKFEAIRFRQSGATPANVEGTHLPAK